ncbi:MAG: TIGR00268 family protein [Planctomycetaceae bacterium]|nr:TIGR00268 family protein [Planctomycetaceae bacterium]HCK42449.1 ATP-dependent sacrificial sulfur transferase LarE [Planctomycetaceae bacterium]
MTQAIPAHEKLVSRIAEFPSCLVAFSGGVDSAVVAKAAHLALGDRATAITGVSASLAAGELEIAQRIAKFIGIRHETLATNELKDPGYLENATNRCWHCKTELYEQMESLANRMGVAVLLNGANLDDQGDFRPGMQAAREHKVRSPLLECGIDKRGVRQLAKHWKLEVWDKPATPCLSSRVVYGLEISPERLARIDAAEQILRTLGLSNLRVRCHQDELARLEVPVEAIPQLCENELRERLVKQLRDLGFQYVTLDLEGFRSGSFLPLVPPSELINK